MSALHASVEAAAGIIRAEPGFVLPRSAFRRVVASERDELLNQLIDLNVIVPGAEEMEIQQLRDYVAWQTERKAQDVRRLLLRPAHQPKRLSREEVITGLREYYEHIKARRENRQRIYLGAGTGEES